MWSIMTIMDKGQLLKTAGWTAIVVGAYAVYLGSMYDGVSTRIRPDDNVIDAEWYEVED
jgi:hypothetical protein